MRPRKWKRTWKAAFSLWQTFHNCWKIYLWRVWTSSERLMYVQFTSCVYMILGDRHYAVSNRYPCKPLQALKTLLYVYFVDTLWFAKSVTFCTSVRFCSADFVLIIINKYCRIFDSIEIKGTFVGNQWFLYVSFDRFSFD